MKLISNPRDGDTIDCYETMYPSKLFYIEGKHEFFSKMSGFYGFVLKGSVEVNFKMNRYCLNKGSFFGIHGPIEVNPGINSRVVIIQRMGYRPLPTLGFIEKKGRLSYIDGCSDSILVHPSRMGDPVLNHLHFPKGINQTQHTHPSIRLGVVYKGNGVAWQQKSTTNKGYEKPLSEGSLFLLEEGEQHSFKTTDSTMDIIAWHPDSEDGPTDKKHPMISRTYINHGKI